jgi:hypothetical protein
MACIERDEDPEDAGALNKHTISKSCIGGYKSALKDFYESVKLLLFKADGEGLRSVRIY